MRLTNATSIGAKKEWIITLNTKMAILYRTQTNTPVFKFRSSPSATTAVAAWTPATSARIVLTDILVYSAAAGTVQLRYGNVAGDIIAEFLLQGSVNFRHTLDTPAVSNTYDRALWIESGMNGIVGVSLGGFEENAS